MGLQRQGEGGGLRQVLESVRQNSATGNVPVNAALVRVGPGRPGKALGGIVVAALVAALGARSAVGFPPPRGRESMPSEGARPEPDGPGAAPTASSRSSVEPAPVASAAAELVGQGLGKGRLRGEVYFSRQEPVIGATVVLVRDGDSSTVIAGTTDRDGAFRFEGIPEGTWTVGVVSEGAAPVVKTGIIVKPPARAVVDIPMKKSAAHLPPPTFDLARFERSPGAGKSAAPASTSVDPAAHAPESAGEPAGTAPRGNEDSGATPGEPHAWFGVVDATMKPVREARITLRSRGPSVDPVRGLTDGGGVARLRAPAPGEYSLRVEMPGFLPVLVEHLVLGQEAPKVAVVLTARPLDYPARPADLVPEEKPVPPEGFPGAAPPRPTGAAG